MNNYPFTPLGVDALMKQLYQLNDEDLALQAASFQADVIDWANANFEFSDSQKIYLANLNPQVLRFISFQGSFAMSNRLSIRLIKPETTGLSESKLSKPKAKMVVTALPDGSYVAEGEFVIEIDY